MADVTLTYKGDTILELNDSDEKVLNTSGKYLEDNILLNYIKSSGGGSEYNILKGSTTPSAGIGQDGDVFLQYFELPSEYQRVEYMDFVPNVGILVTIPTTGCILFSADCSSIKNKTGNEQYSCVFGYRGHSASQKDFMLDFTGTSSEIHGFIRSASNGYVLEAGEAYVSGERVTIHILLKEPRSTAIIGCYLDDAPNAGSATIDDSFHGSFYSLKGNDPATGEVVAWFVPCYRKSDNQVGVYDHIANAFYAETRHYGSGYSITAGPDVPNTQDDIVASFVKVNGAWQSLVGSDVDDVSNSGMYTGIEAPPPVSLGTDGDYYYQRVNVVRSIQDVRGTIEWSNSLGYAIQFTVTEPVTVTHLFARTGAERTGKLQLGTTSEILAETETVSFPAGEWVEVPLASQIQLSTGTNYVVKVLVSGYPGYVSYVKNISNITYDSLFSYVATYYGTSWPGTYESGIYPLVGITYTTSYGSYRILKQFYKDSGVWSEIT